MTLLKRIETVCKRAKEQHSIEEKRAEVDRLQPLLNEARDLSEELGHEVAQLRFLQDQGISTTTQDKAKAARNTLGRLRERFSKESRAEHLTRGRDWTLLKEAVRAACKNLASALQTEWVQFVQTAYRGDTPCTLKENLARTEGNLQNLQRYSEVYAELYQYVRSRPTGRADFDHVRALARQLTKIHQEFDFDVPEEVKHFLRAVADGGAHLDLLSKEVRDWLQQQNTSDHYRIVAKVSSK